MFLSKMPPTDQKKQFISECHRLSLSISELCTTYGICGKTGNRIDSYLHYGHRRGSHWFKAQLRTGSHLVDLVDATETDRRAALPVIGTSPCS
jgi:hypothetical protein